LFESAGGARYHGGVGGEAPDVFHPGRSMARTVKVPAEFLPLFDAAERIVGEYFRRKREEPERGDIDIDGERYVLVRAPSLSVEFYEMMKALYGGREAESVSATKNLLFHLAHFIGRSDARAFHRKMNLKDPIERLSAGPVHFAHTGWAFVDILPESRAAADETFFLLYDHPYSFESDSWRKAGRVASHPVCFMNAGYSSGWCQESFGLPLVATEILCIAKGDPCCRFVMAHPARIEGVLRDYLDRHPEVAAGVTGYEVPGEFERTDLEERLRVSEVRYRSLVENAFEIILLVEDGRIQHANRRATELLGKTRTDLRGMSPAQLAPPVQPDGTPSAEAWRAHSESALAGRTQVFRWRCAAPDGRDLETEVSLSRIEESSGALLAILRDVTERVRGDEERRRLENRVRQLQKMDSLGTLAGGVAHDFNNILGGILGSLDVVQGYLPEGSPAIPFTGEARTLLLRAAALVRNILTFARTSQNVSVLVDVNRILRETADLLRETVDRRIAVQLELDPDAGAVLGDPNHLAQAVVNLALNSRDAILDRLDGPAARYAAGEVPAIRLATSRVRERHPAPEGAGPSSPVEAVRIRVSDNGAGMSPEVRERAFEPFFTTKGPGKGTGLGLAMVFGIVQRHGGWTGVESEPGRGACISLFLPCSTAPAPAPPGPAERKGAAGDETILVVDDEEILRQVISLGLAKLGYRVLTAADGAEGVEVFSRERERISLAVIDYTMPRMSGREVLERIRAIAPGLPVLLVSGHFTDPESSGLREDAATGVLPKPFPLPELVRRIRALLDRNRHNPGIEGLRNSGMEERTRESPNP
jgi:PAS domain S-box-containing protein